MATENVNHPQHYNQHPSGLECIDLIRHYTCDIANAIKYLWRAGLKKEYGQSDYEKEIEDLNKALWYIDDYRRNCVRFGFLWEMEEVDSAIHELTGYHVQQIVSHYTPTIGAALGELFGVGLIFQGEVRHVNGWRDKLSTATERIQKRISIIKQGMEEPSV